MPRYPPLMNFSNRRGESRPSGRVRPRRSVGTRGGCGDGWGPCACPGEWRFRQGFMLTRWISSPGRGQAQGPLIHPTQPLVPTGRLTSLAAFGRQNSSGEARKIAVFPQPRHGSNACDSSSAPARSSPVILSAAKDLAADRDRPFAARRRDTV